MKTTTALIILIVGLSIGHVSGYSSAKKSQPYEIISSTQINKTDYALELKCHNGNKFSLCLPIQKWAEMGMNVNKIIAMDGIYPTQSNQ